MGCSNPSRPRASAPTHTHSPQTPAKTTRPTAYRYTAPPSPAGSTPPPARSLSLSVSLFCFSTILRLSPLQYVICPTTASVHTRPSTLHQLLPVPGPDPDRSPLQRLGGVRARHRPQSPCSSRVRCGRAIHSPVRTWIRLAESWRRPAATASVRGVPPRVRRPRRWRIYRLVAVRRLQWDVGADVRALPWGAVDG
jgi:hypothetical protein